MKSTLTIQHIRAQIWKAAKQKQEVIQQAKTNIAFTDDYTSLLKEVRRIVKKPRVITDDSWKPRYRAAHLKYHMQETPYAILDQQKMMKGKPGWKDDDAYLPTVYPNINTGNGLNRFMAMFLFWSGWRVTRQNVQGRLIEKEEPTDGGQMITTKKYIKSTTRVGTADIGATILGRSCQFEGKAGKDQPRTDQLREQKIERKAGGIYEFIHSPDEFYKVYDEVIKRFSGE